MKVYTKTGDAGTTSLIGGERVSKDDPRVEAYGTVDELAAHLGLLADFVAETEGGFMSAAVGGCAATGDRAGGLTDFLPWLEAIQHDLMWLEAELATIRPELDSQGESSVSPQGGVGLTEKSENEKSEAERRIDEAVGRLENQIDAMSESLPPVTYFAIPSGHRVVSQGHVCRTVCRRAERVTITSSRHYAISPQTAAYLNRLSDWLYVFGRKAVAALGVKQSLWTP